MEISREDMIRGFAKEHNITFEEAEKAFEDAQTSPGLIEFAEFLRKMLAEEDPAADEDGLNE